MSTRCTAMRCARLRCIFRLCLGSFATSTAVGCAIPAHGQTASLSDAWAAYLRPGCHVVLVLPTVRLAVQTKWLGFTTIGHLANLYRGVCPSEPVKVQFVEFGRPVLDVLKIQSGLGRDFFRLFVDAAPALNHHSTTTPPPPPATESGQIAPIDAAIKMDSESERSFGDRLYEIRYVSSHETVSGEVHIGCGGIARMRVCEPAPYPTFSGLLVKYTLSQRRLPIPEIASTDPSTEPGAILQYDRRLREWLISLERMPANTSETH